MKKTAFDVIVCGSLHLDIVVDAPHLPWLDETAVGTAWRQVCGGKGGNQAVQAARAGAVTAMISRVGQDDFGQKLLTNLERGGVDTSCVARDETAGSGMSVAILNSDGDYGAVIVSGSNLKINPQTLASEWRQLGGAAVLVLQNEVPDAVNLAMAKLARQAGAKVVFNAAPARPNFENLLDYVDVLVVNRIEAEAFSSISVSDFQGARAAAPGLVSATRSVVITLGGQGLVVAPAGGEMVNISPIAVKVASTHGAGDCFVGTLATRLAKGEDLVAACRFANAAAADFVAGRAANQ